MPQTDYSNTLILEIKCKDPTVKYSEIRPTTNLKCFKHRLRKETAQRDAELCQAIKENGGMKNWDFSILEAYKDSNSKQDTKIRVEEWRSGRRQLITTIPEQQTKNNQNEFYCKYCDCNYSCKGNYEKHLLTPKHKKNKSHHRKSTRIEPSKTCQHCSQEFCTVFSLNRHKPRCKILKEEENVLEARIQYLENELQKYKNIVDQLSKRRQATDTNQRTI